MKRDRKIKKAEEDDAESGAGVVLGRFSVKTFLRRWP
jgi:hypothetical protein